jgi:multidrug efflux pump subunit AcrA (membrane-fusion protein)
MKTSKIVTAVIVVITVALAALIVFALLPKKQEDAAARPGARPGGNTQPAVIQVTPVELGTVENTVVINGDILARNQVAIFPTMQGRLAETRIGIGDTVRVGSIVAMVDPSRPGEVFSLNPVVSTVSGTVLQAPLSVGDTVSPNSTLYVVGDLSSLRIESFVPERFVSTIKTGLLATVTLEALPGETFYATIDEVSPVLDPASRTLRIRLLFVNSQRRPAQDPRIRAGMFSTVSLVTDSRNDVPVIPRSAAINTQGKWIAFVVDENSIARQRDLELGMESETTFEILGGLELGEQVVSAGQNFLSDGDPVRTVN